MFILKRVISVVVATGLGLACVSPALSAGFGDLMGGLNALQKSEAKPASNASPSSTSAAANPLDGLLSVVN